MLCAAAIAAVPARIVTAQPKHAPASPPADEFFIVSSIDPSKGQLLLKKPTEVTDVMRVDGETRFLDEHGNLITLARLRAGDTVFVRSKAGAGGAVALEIRQGPMTVAELQKRYLHRP